MSWSDTLSLGEIAYDGYHALDPIGSFPPFNRLSEDEQARWGSRCS